MFKNKCPHPYHLTKRRKTLDRKKHLIVIICLIGVFFLGQLSVSQNEDYEEERKRLQGLVDELTVNNKSLVKQQDFVASSKNIDAQARLQYRQVLTQLTEEVAGLKEQLLFYQRVVAPESITKGLYIESFSLQSTRDTQRYQYSLVLAKSSSQKGSVKGGYSLSLVGHLQGKPTTLRANDLFKDQDQRQNFSFRYYQQLTGELLIPEGFSAVKLVLTINPDSKKYETIKNEWSWIELLGKKAG